MNASASIPVSVIFLVSAAASLGFAVFLNANFVKYFRPQLRKTAYAATVVLVLAAGLLFGVSFSLERYGRSLVYGVLDVAELRAETEFAGTRFVRDGYDIGELDILNGELNGYIDRFAVDGIADVLVMSRVRRSLSASLDDRVSFVKRFSDGGSVSLSSVIGGTRHLAFAKLAWAFFWVRLAIALCVAVYAAYCVHTGLTEKRQDGGAQKE